MSDCQQRARKFCAYQERCHKEVRIKLISWGLRGQEVEEIISQLITEGFLDEERFARAYARGKFRMKGFGKRKIINELKSRDISGYCIQQALLEIDAQEYVQFLRQGVKKKLMMKGDNGTPLEIRKKIMTYFLGRGFEGELIDQVFKEISERD